MPDRYSLLVTARQEAELAAVVRARRNTTAGDAGVPGRPANRPAVVRVIAPKEPRYNPGTAFLCPVFEYFETDPHCTTIYLTGQGLRGRIVLTIEGTQLPPIAAAASQSELTAHVAAALPDHVVSVWPGVWEFDGRGKPATITAEPEEPPDPLPEGEVFDEFNGSVQVVRERWVAAKTIDDSGNIEYETITLTDALPYTDAAVSAGSIGLVAWHDGAGFVPIAWQCRPVSFDLEPLQ